jgi:hypothetical protein
MDQTVDVSLRKKELNINWPQDTDIYSTLLKFETIAAPVVWR